MLDIYIKPCLKWSISSVALQEQYIMCRIHMGPKQMPIKSLATHRDFLHKAKLGVVMAVLPVAIQHILTRLHSRQTSLLPCLPPTYFMTITLSLQVSCLLQVASMATAKLLEGCPT